MAVTVRLPTVLRPHANGQSQVSAEAGTVADALSGLVERFPAIGPNLLADDGSLHRFVNVYVNDEDVRYLQGTGTALSEGDSVSFLPALAGGR